MGAKENIEENKNSNIHRKVSNVERRKSYYNDYSLLDDDNKFLLRDDNEDNTFQFQEIEHIKENYESKMKCDEATKLSMMYDSFLFEDDIDTYGDKYSMKRNDIFIRDTKEKNTLQFTGNVTNKELVKSLDNYDISEYKDNG